MRGTVRERRTGKGPERRYRAMEKEAVCVREVRERNEAAGITAQEKEEYGAMRIDIWTIREEHIVFEKVNSYKFSEREKFLCIRRGLLIDYLPTLDIQRITVNELPRRKK